MPTAEPGQPLPSTSSPTRREHWQALLLACCCALLFLRESLLPGRALVPYPPELFDVVMAEAIEADRFDPDDAFRGNVGMGDKYLQSLCWDRVMQDRFRQGELPRWTNDIGGGAPFVPQMAQPYQPINLLLLLLPSEQWYGWWYLIHQVLFGWFAYVFLRRLGCLHAAALLGLVAAVLGMWTQCKLHHNVILTAALSLWPMLIAVHDLVASGVSGRARRWSIGWLALWTGLSWSSGFVVVSLQATYLTLAFAAFCALRAERGDRLRRLLPVGIGLAIGAVLSFANMLPVLLASSESARAGTFDAARLARLGLEWDHLLTLCWPDLLSWPADRFYVHHEHGLFAYDTRMPLSQLVLLADPLRPEDSSAFQNWVETSFAIGVMPLAAAVSALFGRRHRAIAWLFGAIALLAFGMATADQPFFVLARILPGVAAGDLRRLLFSVAMPLVVLTGLGADVWLRDGSRNAARTLCIAIATMSTVALWWLWRNAAEPDFVLAFAKLFVMDADDARVLAAAGSAEVIAGRAAAIAAPAEFANNHSMLVMTATRTLLAALIGLFAVWRMRRWTMLACIAVTVAELVLAGLGPMQTVPAERVTRLPAVLQPLVDDTLPNGVRPRLCRLVAADARKDAAMPGNMPGFLHVEDSSAYNPLPSARQEQFFKAIDPTCVYGGAGVGSLHDPAALRHALCDLFGVRFVLTRLPQPDNPDLVDRTPSGSGAFHLYERPSALPRATFVRAIDLLTDRDERLAALAVADREVALRMVLEDPSATRPAPADAVRADVRITQHRDERVVLTVTCSHDGYVRLADPYDPGWCASIDDEATRVYVADHYLRAVYVEAGEHEIVFSYDAARVVWPLRLSLLALLGIGWLLVTGWRRR